MSQEDKFPTSEFLSFLRSISLHSKSLQQVFAQQPFSDQAQQPAASPGGGSACGASDARSASASMMSSRGGGEDGTMLDAGGPVFPAEFQGVTDNVTDLIQHQHRMEEVQRRRFEMQDGATLQRKKTEFVKWIMSELASVVPVSGRISLINSIREYLGNNRASSVQVC